MIGLQEQIEARRTGKKLNSNEKISYVYIAKILNKPYNTTRRKIENGNLTVEEALKIFNGIGFQSASKFDAFIYLFTNQQEG